MAVHITLADTSKGYPGVVSRAEHLIVEPAWADEALGDIEPGRVITYKDGKATYFKGDGSDEQVGLIIRPIPTPPRMDGSDKLEKGSLLSIMRRGFMFVKCTNGEPKQGDQVYMYKEDNGGHYKGEFSATEDSTYTVKIPGARWAASGVVNKVAEINVI